MRPLESAIDPGYRMETHVEETTVMFDQNGMDMVVAEGAFTESK
jgi:septum formation protein